jgi:sensor histidine kinase YesM
MKKYVEFFVHGVIWLLIYLLFIYGANTIGVFQRADGTIFIPLTIGTILNISLFYFISLFLIPWFSEGRKPIVLVGQLSGLLLGITALESMLDFFYFTNVYSTEDESFGSQLIINLISNALILSLAMAYGFTRNWMKNEKLRRSLKQEKLKAELDFLKTQINPHFLFNVLNMAFSSATSTGDEKTANIIEKLAGLLRYMLYECNADHVALEKDIQYIENYIMLQKMRLSSDIPVNITFQIKGNYSRQYIAPLILIPFVENAFKHGIKLDDNSFISITLQVENSTLIFRIENSIVNLNNNINKNESGIGLENVKKRLAILYPAQHNLKISKTDTKFVVDLSLNLKAQK